MIKKITATVSRKVQSGFAKWKFREFIAKDVHVHYRSQIHGAVSIGEHSNINGVCYLRGHVTIGKWCAIAHELRARSANHATQYANMQAKMNVRHGFVDVHGIEKGGIRIGNACWIGDRVIILSGVTIGDGAILGAGSVVTRDVPPFSVAAGNPAKVIRTRFSDQTTEALLKIKWWDWSEERIARNKRFFEADLSELELENQVYDLVVD